MGDWTNVTECEFPGFVVRFPAAMPASRAVCPWHGDHLVEPGLTETLAQKFLKGLAS